MIIIRKIPGKWKKFLKIAYRARSMAPEKSESVILQTGKNVLQCVLQSHRQG